MQMAINSICYLKQHNLIDENENKTTQRSHVHRLLIRIPASEIALEFFSAPFILIWVALFGATQNAGPLF